MASARGSGTCPRCAQTYSNRWKPANCRSCGHDLGGHVKKMKLSHVIPEVSVVTESLFSVKVTPKGDDFRCLVEVKDEGAICSNKKCLETRSAHLTSGGLPEMFSCAHISACKNFTGATRPATTYKLTRQAIEAALLDQATKSKLIDVLESVGDQPAVVKVSDVSYAVWGHTSASNPLGYCHVQVKNNIAKCLGKTCGKLKGKGSKAGRTRDTCNHLFCLIVVGVTENEPGPSGSIQVDPDHSTPAQDVEKTRKKSALILQKTVRIQYGDDAMRSLFKIICAHDSAGSWPKEYGPTFNSCQLCGSNLSEKRYRSGHDPVEDVSYMLTMTHSFVPVHIFCKYCKNRECKAMHIAMPIDKGLLNIADKLLVSIDILVNIRNMMKRGCPLEIAVQSIIETLLLKADQANTPSSNTEVYLTKMLEKGYWGFEALTERNLDDVVCGICGTIPEYLIGDGNEKNCCSDNNIIFSDDGYDTTDSAVEVDDVWREINLHLLENLVYAKMITSFKINYRRIPYFISPSLRAETVINTEHGKKSKVKEERTKEKIEGDPNMLSLLVRTGELEVTKLAEYDSTKLKNLCKQVQIRCTSLSAALMRKKLSSLYEDILCGNSPCHGFNKAAGQTGGYYIVVCRHGVIYTSKAMSLRESVRDACDSYLSLKYPPPLFFMDTPCTFARNLELCYPELSKEIWGDNMGCFEQPSKSTTPTENISMPMLVPTEYRSGSVKLPLEDELGYMEHPLTRSKRRVVLQDRFHGKSNPHVSPLCDFHNPDLCVQTNGFKTSYAECENSSRKSQRIRSTCAQSVSVHLFYNYLMDFYSNEKIVRGQRSNLLRMDTVKDVTRGPYMRYQLQ